MCEEAVAIDRESDRIWDICCALPDDTTGTHPALIAYDEHEEATLPCLQDLMQVVTETPARTPEGLPAKAALARKAMPLGWVEDGASCDRLSQSLYTDVLGSAGA